MTRKIRIGLMVFLILSMLVQGMNLAYAAPVDRVDTKITEFTITKSDDSVLPEYSNDSVMKLNISWDATSYGNELKAGDYFNVTLPKEFRFPKDPNSCNFDLKEPGGAVMAKAVVTPGSYNEGGGNIKVTFTNWVEGKYEVKGKMGLLATFNKSIVNTPGTLNVNVAIGSFIKTATINVTVTPSGNVHPEEVFTKWPWKVTTDAGNVKWEFRVNFKKADLKGVVLRDTVTVEGVAPDGIEIIKDSFTVQEVVMKPNGQIEPSSPPAVSIKDDPNLVISPDKRSFTYNWGDIGPKQYFFRYETTVKPGAKLKNSARLESTSNGAFIAKSEFNYATSGGEGTGNLKGKIKIVKVDADDPTVTLAGAVFKITKVGGTDSVQITTGPNGEAVTEVLPAGNYLIEELNPPDGYTADFPGKTVSVDGTTGVIETIKNNPVKIDIKVKKTWVGFGAQDPVEMVLKADGAQVGNHTLTAVDSWTYTFTGMRKYKPGTNTEIVYTVEERNVPAGYNVTYSGNVMTGFEIINTRQPVIIPPNPPVIPPNPPVIPPNPPENPKPPKEDPDKPDNPNDPKDENGGSSVPKDGENTPSDEGKNGTPKTGDENQMVLWGMLMGASLLTSVTLASKKKNEK